MRIPFDEKYKSLSIFDFPKLRMKKKEVALILMIETDAIVAFTHYIDAGENDDNSGYYHCHGNFDVMCKENFDANCKICVKAREGQPGISTARRRFVSHILRYRTDQATNKVIDPPSVELLLWVYADDKYNSLTSKRESWKDLRKHDLKITCVKEKYQGFEIDVEPSALWITHTAQDAEGKTLKEKVVTVYNEQKRNDEDLLTLLGRRVDTQGIEKLLATLAGKPTEVGGAPIDGQPADLLGDLGAAPSISPPTDASPGAAGGTGSGGAPVQMDFNDLLNV